MEIPVLRVLAAAARGAGFMSGGVGGCRRLSKILGWVEWDEMEA
jgi:hypothetical protein